MPGSAGFPIGLGIFTPANRNAGMTGLAQAWLGRVVPGPADFPIGLGKFTPANKFYNAEGMLVKVPVEGDGSALGGDEGCGGFTGRTVGGSSRHITVPGGMVVPDAAWKN